MLQNFQHKLKISATNLKACFTFIISLFALSSLFFCLAISPNTAFAEGSEFHELTPVVDLNSSNATETANNVASKMFPSGCNTVVIVPSNSPAAVACATGLAGVLDAPILLAENSSLSGETISAISTLGAKSAYVVNSENSISSNLNMQLNEAGIKHIEKVSGENVCNLSYECWKKIAELSGNPNSQAIIASASNIEDLASLLPFSYKYKVPIFFVHETVDAGSLSEHAFSAISAACGISGTVFVAGGFSNVSKANAEDVFGQYRTVRFQGKDCLEISKNVANYMTSKTNNTSQQYMTSKTIVVSDKVSAGIKTDTVASAALAGKSGGVFLISNGNVADMPFVNESPKSISSVYIDGSNVTFNDNFKNLLKSNLNKWHIVTFKNDDGSVYKTQQVWDGDTVSQPAEPQKQDYIFNGWYSSNAEDATLHDFKKQITTDTTLYAHWTSYEFHYMFMAFQK